MRAKDFDRPDQDSSVITYLHVLKARGKSLDKKNTKFKNKY